MSTSSAPAATASFTSASLTSRLARPLGNAVATLATWMPVPVSSAAATWARSGYTQTAATCGAVGSAGSGRLALAHRARTLPGVSWPSSVVRSIIEMARSRAHCLAVVLIDRLASMAARASAPTWSTPGSPCRNSRSEMPATGRMSAVALIGDALLRVDQGCRSHSHLQTRWPGRKVRAVPHSSPARGPAGPCYGRTLLPVMTTERTGIYRAPGLSFRHERIGYQRAAIRGLEPGRRRPSHQPLRLDGRQPGSSAIRKLLRLICASRWIAGTPAPEIHRGARINRANVTSGTDALHGMMLGIESDNAGLGMLHRTGSGAAEPPRGLRDTRSQAGSGLTAPPRCGGPGRSVAPRCRAGRRAGGKRAALRGRRAR